MLPLMDIASIMTRTSANTFGPMEITNKDTEWRQFLTPPDESKLLYEMVSNFHGGKPVCVRSPHLITNQEDDTEFICKGKQVEKSSHVGLVATTALKTQITLSMYHQDNSNNMNAFAGEASSAQQCLW